MILILLHDITCNRHGPFRFSALASYPIPHSRSAVLQRNPHRPSLVPTKPDQRDFRVPSRTVHQTIQRIAIDEAENKKSNASKHVRRHGNHITSDGVRPSQTRSSIKMNVVMMSEFENSDQCR